MKIFIGSDHAGFKLKEKLIPFLAELGHEVVDKGAFSYNESDDYPDFVKPVAEEVSKNNGSKGVIIGKSGQGEAMCANRIMGVRAAVWYGGNTELIKLSREHNDANILSFAGGFVSEEEAMGAINLWLETPFSHAERHVRRIEKLDK